MCIRDRAYRDSLYAILPPESEEYLLMREASFRDQRQYEDALKVNDLRLTKIEPYTPQYAMATYHRSLIYKYSNDSLGEKRNLCLSAISDIRSAIKAVSYTHLDVYKRQVIKRIRNI